VRAWIEAVRRNECPDARAVHATAVTLLAFARARLVHAADATAAYPAKPIRFIVGFMPGGTSDVVARLLALKLAKTWTQPPAVDNRPGHQGGMRS
jgi:tripartite-type tricarboxylate transporter receptor subunit TctC